MVALQALWSPVRALEAAARERRAALGFGVVALGAVLGLISTAISTLGGAFQLNPQDFPGVPPEVLQQVATSVQVATPILAVLSPFVWWVLLTLVMQLVTGFFGGSGPISAMFAAVGLAYMPFLINGVIGIPFAGIQAVVDPQSAAATLLGLLSFLLTLAFLIWHVALVIVGASFAREVSYGRSGGSCVISCAGCGGLVLAVTVALVLAGVALGSGG